MKEKFSIIIISCLLSIYSCFAQVPNTDSMLPKIAAEKSDSARARLIWHCLGTSETDPVLDMEIAEKLYKQSKITNDPIEEVIALSCIGYDYRAFGDNKKSLTYNLRAVSVADKNPNEEAKSGAYLALALNYEDLGDYTKAIKLFSTATDYAIKTKFDEVLSLCYMSFGELYLNMNKIDSALMYSQRGYELTMRIGYKDYLGPLLQQLGSIHVKLGNSALAISYYDMAIKEGYRMNSPKFINTSYTAIAQYYLDAHQRDSAIAYARKAITVVQNT